jgi:hypothetical protein
MSGRLGGYQLNRGLAPKSDDYLQNFVAEGQKNYSPEGQPPLNSGYLGPTSPESTSSPDLAGQGFDTAMLGQHGGTGAGTGSPDLASASGVNPNHPGTNPNHPDSTTPTAGAEPLPPPVNWNTPGWTNNLSALDKSSYDTLKGQSDPYTLAQTGFNPLSYGFWGG